MDRLQAMQVFTRVVEGGSFTKAADLLQLPRATVTTVIQDLEVHLGVRLLHRTTRRVNVTVDGAAYYERCIRLLGELEEIETSFSHAANNPKGKLKIDVQSTLGRRVIVPALPAFHARYPGIQLEIGMTDRLVDLVEEGIDASFVVESSVPQASSRDGSPCWNRSIAPKPATLNAWASQ